MSVTTAEELTAGSPVADDPFGHHWSLGQPVREVSMEEIQAAMSGAN